MWSIAAHGECRAGKRHHMVDGLISVAAVRDGMITEAT
jgi:hypothetical protein